MESELAWVQHALAHTAPGGLALLLMPPAAADRRSGRRIRAELLRRGALRAVIGLPLGVVPNTAVALTVWALRRPIPGERPPDEILMADTAADPEDFHEVALRAWRAFLDGADPRPGVRVRIIDLLDDEVDLTPARRLPQRAASDRGGAFVSVREELMGRAAEFAGALPALTALAPAVPRDEVLVTTVGDLVKTGALTIVHGPSKVPEGECLPLLTLDDVRAFRDPPPMPASARARAAEAGLVPLVEGDLVVSMLSRYPETRVISEPGLFLGPNLFLVRVDPERCDPHFLAGRLRIAAKEARSRSSTGSVRFDLRRARVPRLPLADQHAQGEAFRRLADLQAALRELVDLGDATLRLAYDGLATGTLERDGA
jgi:hypothetical protein